MTSLYYWRDPDEDRDDAEPEEPDGENCDATERRTGNATNK